MVINKTMNKDHFLRLLESKGTNRIQVNNILSAVCIGVLSFLLFSNIRINPWVVGQLSIAVPLLITSSLAYAKVCYRHQEAKYWDMFGWLTHSVGYVMILNSITIYIYEQSESRVAWLFVIMVVILFIFYSFLDIILKRKRLVEKVLKLLFYLLLLLAGSIMPILLKLI